MSVGFRSFVHAAPGQHLVTVLIEHLNSWMASKDVGVDAAAAGQYVLEHGNVITVIDEAHDAGRIYRWTRFHPDAYPREVSRSTITAFEHPDRPGWLWAEITAQNEPRVTSQPMACMSVPRVLRTLFGALSLTDGRTEIAAEPLWITSRHLPDVMDYLADESRLGPIYVASQAATPREDFEEWVTEVTWHLTGMGTVLLLDNAVEAEFNEMVGEEHAIPPGTIRTYLPNVDLDDPLDPRRHRILGVDRIRMSAPRRLAGMLGLAARMRAAQLRLPAEVLAADTYLRAAESAAEANGNRGILRAIPSAESAAESALLAKLDAMEREIHAMRAALHRRESSARRHLSVS